ncbi:DUF397 domain-containing protein [Sphaerisporangium sp. NPDC051011]|uniref:DUF397 domain-containing protein n=1 Tax=Sphaerisporangium sp. NPDC051011 TaxID=3155792 RepID=UPI0033ECA364
MASSSLVWRKSTYSGHDDNCVEIASLADGGRAVRDSKHPNKPGLTLGAAEWQVFILGVKKGKFG